MTIKYVMAKITDDDKLLVRGHAYVTQRFENDPLYDILEDDGRGIRHQFETCTQAEHDEWFVEMTEDDYEMYFNACANGYEDVWTLIRRLYDCN